MPSRTLSKRIDNRQARDLIDAAHHASTLEKPLNTFVALNPRLLDEMPACIADWTKKVLNNVRIHMNRLQVARGSESKRKVGYFLIWARENYEGTDREHLHFVVHCPVHEMLNFRDALQRWYPGEEEAIYVEKARIGTNRFTGRRQNFSLTYVLKQCTPQARWATGFQIMYDRGCKRTGAKVAPVLGKRCGVSETLSFKAREAYRLRLSSGSSATASLKEVSGGAVAPHVADETSVVPDHVTSAALTLPVAPSRHAQTRARRSCSHLRTGVSPAAAQRPSKHARRHAA